MDCVRPMSLAGLFCTFIVLSAASARAQPQMPEVVCPRAILINYDPIIESHGGERLHVVRGWNDPLWLTNEYIADFVEASHQLFRQRLIATINVDEFPLKVDGFRYTDEQYLAEDWHFPDGVNYRAIVRGYDLARRVDAGEIDEVLIHGGPYFGYWESHMAGRGAYYLNSGPETRVASSRMFVMMGFNYERGVAEMLHSFGHRSEDLCKTAHGGFWDITQSRTDWERFTHNIQQSGDAACGTVHYPPNAAADYDYANGRYVDSTAIDWMNNFPDLTGATSSINREAWGGPDYHRNFMKWWYGHMPHVGGTNDHDEMIRMNNWWVYLADFNRYEETGGDHAPGGSAPPAEPFDRVPTALTADARDDWWPRANAAGRVVWYASDGNDFEVYSADADGSDLVQITNNAFWDRSPRINASGRVVWQAFDGQDWEIFTANADGSDLVQVTDNAVNDWHPDLNDAGRVVWDGFDGVDYEIFSADADGSDLVQITDNYVASGRPRDDVWPRINAAGRVVWFGFDRHDWEIYGANADGTDFAKLSDNLREDEYPEISDAGRVVWHAFHSDANTEIYSVDAAGGTPLRLTDNSAEDWYPQISASGQVVWMARAGGDWEIRTVEATGGPITSVTSNEQNDEHPVIDDDGRIVWQGFDGNDWEIYAHVDGTVYQLTDNDYDDRAPHISPSGRVTWHAEATAGTDGSTTEVFAVSLASCPADLDNDGDVDLADLAQLLAHYGMTGGAQYTDGDLDGDDDVDLADLAALLAVYGTICE